MKRVEDLYDHSDLFLEFDTLSPDESTIAHGYKKFQAVWEPAMANSTHAITRLNDDMQVSTDGKLGLTTFTFHTEAKDRNTNEEFSADAQLLWFGKSKTANG
jgi:ketosteroid isomerase-like protein